MTQLNEVLDHWAEALGGRATLAEIKTISSYDLVYYGTDIQICGTQTLRYDAQARYLSDLEISGGTSLLTIADTPSGQGWYRDSDDNVTELSSAVRQALRAHLYWLLNGALVNGPVAGSVDLEEETDRYCWLSAQPEEASSFKLRLDKKTWLPDEIRGLGAADSHTQIVKWRWQAGVRFPFELKELDGVLKNMVTHRREVEVNAWLDPELFTKPSQCGAPVAFKAASNPIPIDVLDNNVFTTARLNDIEMPNRFGVDTGTSSCVISVPLAEQAGLSPRCKSSATIGGGSETTTLNMTEGVRFGLAGVTFHNHNLLVIDLSALTGAATSSALEAAPSAPQGMLGKNLDQTIHFGQPGLVHHKLLAMDLSPMKHANFGQELHQSRGSQFHEATSSTFDGILGGNFLRHTVVELDMPERLLCLHEPEEFQAPADAKQLPIAVSGHVPYIDATVAIGELEITGSFMLDNGAHETLYFSNSFVRKHGLEDVVPNLRQSACFGLGGEFQVAVGRVDTLSIGSQRFEHPWANLSLIQEGSLGNTSYAGIIGSEIWRRLRLFLDYGRKELSLKPNAVTDEPFVYDMSGLVLMTGGASQQDVVVRYVMDNSPASLAKLQKGDTMTSLDGCPASELSLDHLRTELKQEGAERTLGIRRGDQQFEVTLRLCRLV